MDVESGVPLQPGAHRRTFVRAAIVAEPGPDSSRRDNRQPHPGRVQIQPDHVIDLVHEHRIVRQLDPSARCGLSSNAFQIRPIMDGEGPDRCAIFVLDQCVAFFGVDSTWPPPRPRPGRQSPSAADLGGDGSRRSHLLGAGTPSDSDRPPQLTRGPDPSPLGVYGNLRSRCTQSTRTGVRNRPESAAANSEPLSDSTPVRMTFMPSRT